MATKNSTTKPFDDFKERFKLLASKNSEIVINTLSNIFTMRLIGNKTHGDLAEIGIMEFINQFMYDFKSKHVGKNKFRSKEHEEDIIIINELTKIEFPVSLKAYGVGPLQLSTDSESRMFTYLKEQDKKIIDDESAIQETLSSPTFSNFLNVNVMPLIYNESEKLCNIMIFDNDKAFAQTAKIIYIGAGKSHRKQQTGKRRKHPMYVFLDAQNNYICEVRYGGKTANALQRGLWTHTKKAAKFFDSITNGWISYKDNLILVELFRLALNATEKGQQQANKILQDDIDRLKKPANEILQQDIDRLKCK